MGHHWSEEVVSLSMTNLVDNVDCNIPSRDRRGCLVRVWQCLWVAAILYFLIVLVCGVAVGGHDGIVPHGAGAR
jgi:hypothetical protein